MMMSSMFKKYGNTDRTDYEFPMESSSVEFPLTRRNSNKSLLFLSSNATPFGFSVVHSSFLLALLPNTMDSVLNEGESILFLDGVNNVYRFSITVFSYSESAIREQEQFNNNNTNDDYSSRRFCGKVSTIPGMTNQMISDADFASVRFSLLSEQLYDIQYFPEYSNSGFQTCFDPSSEKPTLLCSDSFGSLFVANFAQRYIQHTADPNIGFWPIAATFRIQIFDPASANQPMIMVCRPAFPSPNYVSFHEWASLHSDEDNEIIVDRIAAYLNTASNSRIAFHWSMVDRSVQDHYIFCSTTPGVSISELQVWIFDIKSGMWTFKIPEEEFFVNVIHPSSDLQTSGNDGYKFRDYLHQDGTVVVVNPFLYHQQLQWHEQEEEFKKLQQEQLERDFGNRIGEITMPDATTITNEDSWYITAPTITTIDNNLDGVEEQSPIDFPLLLTSSSSLDPCFTAFAMEQKEEEKALVFQEFQEPFESSYDEFGLDNEAVL